MALNLLLPYACFGAFKYMMIEGSEVTLSWVRKNVVYVITKFCRSTDDSNNTIAKVLGVELLCACMDEV